MLALKTPQSKCQGFYFLTPVWGASYTKLYLDIVIPAQLAPDNLPAFASVPGTKYLIFTTPADAEVISQSPVFAQLSSIVDVQVELITQPIVVPHDTMSECFRRGIQLADAAGAACAFLTPDLVFANGSFATIKRLVEQGRDVVFVPGIRTLKQGVAITLDGDFKSDGVINIAPRQLMKIALDNLHPLANSSFWEEGESDLIPANIYWRVGTEGILAKCYHLHPLLVRPQKRTATFFGTVDDDYVSAACPNVANDYVVKDSDDLLCIELSDPNRFFITGFRKGSVDDVTIWAEQFASARHRLLFKHEVRMHTGMQNQGAWDEAKLKAEQVERAISQRLARPLWQLIIKADNALPRRLIRLGQDAQLADANNVRSLQAINNRYHRLVARSLLSGFKMIARGIHGYSRLARGLSSLMRSVNRFVFGDEKQPRPWSWQYMYRKAVKSDMAELCGKGAASGHKAGSTLIVCNDLASSTAFGLVGERAMTGVFVPGGSSVQIVDRATSTVVPTDSCQLVIMEQTLPKLRDLAGAASEIARIVAPGGRLLCLSNRLLNPFSRNDQEIGMTAGAVSDLFSPEFKIIEQRYQGAYFSSTILATIAWMKLTLTRLRIPFVLLMPIMLLVLPFRLLLTLLSSTVTYLLDRADITGRCYICSMSLMERVEGVEPGGATSSPESHPFRETQPN